MTSKRKNKLTHEMFFKVCEQMRNDREIISSKISSIAQLVEHLTKACGFVVPVSSAETAKRMTDIPLFRKSKQKKSPGLSNMHIIARSVINLYKEHGQTIPDQLIELSKQLEGSGGVSLSRSEEKKEGNE